MPIIDTHAHIDHIADWPAAYKRAQEAEVSDIIAVSVDAESMQKILDLAKTEGAPRIHPALGIHPEKVQNGLAPKEVFDFIRAHAGETVAIGETGLDFWYRWVKENQAEKDKQRSNFSRHLEIAKEFDLPIIIHSRGAWDECVEMTKQAGVKKALFHWYSGPINILHEVIEAGFYVSTSPSVAYSPQSQAAMLEAPVNRIVIETDSPVTYRDGAGSFLSEPKDVVRTLKALSRLKNVDEEELLKIVNGNAKEFFKI